MSFFALVHRMRYVKRWGLMRNVASENLQEHAYEVAVIAQTLALIRREFGDGSRFSPEPDRVAVVALYHDLPEIITGDLPTPVKYNNTNMRQVFGEIEEEAKDRIIKSLPKPFQAYYGKIMDAAEMPTDESDSEAVAICELVKAADRISAYIKCVDERKAGNSDFAKAEEGVLKRLLEMELPEVKYWLKEIQPKLEITLDEI